MKTADELFEEQGFTISERDSTFIEYVSNKGNCTIEFNLNSPHIFVDVYSGLTPMLLLAMLKKAIEEGWLGE